jgi:16S rRNA (guanine1207-N2)-methyltransferase
MSRHDDRNAALETIMLALENDPQLIPGKGQVGFLRARPHAGLKQFSDRLICQQDFKTAAEALELGSYKLVDRITEKCSLILLLPDRQKEQTLADFAHAYDQLDMGGVLMVGLHNDWGAKRYEKHLAELAGEIQTLSKYHCRAFWIHKTEKVNETLLEEWRRFGELQRILEGRFWSCPGLFNWDEIDKGSQLLVENLPKNINGKVADLGSSWGFLSDFIMRNYPDITLLDLFEADRIALEAAKRNLGSIHVKLRAQYHWADVTKGVGEARYDFIVMNPPFHEGRHTDHLLGAKFIAAAARALKPGGQLWMVANRHLPYERYFPEVFAQSSIPVQNNGFKVMMGVK